MEPTTNLWSFAYHHHHHHHVHAMYLPRAQVRGRCRLLQPTSKQTVGYNHKSPISFCVSIAERTHHYAKDRHASVSGEAALLATRVLRRCV